MPFLDVTFGPRFYWVGEKNISLMKTLLPFLFFLIVAAAPTVVSAQNTSDSALVLPGLSPDQCAFIEQLLSAPPDSLPPPSVCYDLLIAAGVPEGIAQQVVAELVAADKPRKD